MQKSLSGLSPILSSSLCGCWTEFLSGKKLHPMCHCCSLACWSTCWNIILPWSLSESMLQFFLLPLHLQYHFLEDSTWHLGLLISSTVNHISTNLIILHPHECQFPLLSWLWSHSCSFPPGRHLWLCFPPSHTYMQWVFSENYSLQLFQQLNATGNISSTANQLLFLQCCYLYALQGNLDDTQAELGLLSIYGFYSILAVPSSPRRRCRERHLHTCSCSSNAGLTQPGFDHALYFLIAIYNASLAVRPQKKWF